MTEGLAASLFSQGVALLLTLSLPPIGVGLGVGLLIALFQAITQIQEQTLTFVPKLIAVLLTLSMLFPWMASRLMNWVTELWTNIPTYI
jgi:flagellar biosynthesis protein FliQ